MEINLNNQDSIPSFTESLPTATNTTQPFDNPNADVILRSLDNVDFRTFKLVLSLASDLFDTMFSLPSPSKEDSDQVFKDGLPVIQIEAESSDLRRLLLFCHPGKAPEICRLLEVQSLAMKYEMEEVARRILKERICGVLDLIPPIMLDTIKQKAGQDDNILLAAGCAILFPTERHDVIVPRLVTQSQFNALLRYHEKCGQAAQSVARPDYGHYNWASDAWIRKRWFSEDHKHAEIRSCEKAGTIYVGNVGGKFQTRRWWSDYMLTAWEELMERPSGSIVTSGQLFDEALRRGSACSTCRPGLNTGLREFAALFAGEVDKAVKAVPLNWNV